MKIFIILMMLMMNGAYADKPLCDEETFGEVTDLTYQLNYQSYKCYQSLKTHGFSRDPQVCNSLVPLSNTYKLLTTECYVENPDLEMYSKTRSFMKELRKYE